MDNKSQKICSCGCGKLIEEDKIFVWGHNGKGIPRSKEVIHKMLKTREHGKILFLKRKCGCGCGKWAEPKNKFIQGHFFKNKTRSYENIIEWYFSRWGKWPQIELRMCKCGCKEYLNTKDCKKFIVGHTHRGITETEEHKKKIGLGNKGKIVPKAVGLKISKAKKGKKIKPNSEEGKKNKSQARKKFLQNNPWKLSGFSYGKQGHFFSKKNNKKLHYRSSYELVAYQILEQMSKVQTYEVEPFGIPYQYKGEYHTTIPDLLITYTDGVKELIEVKPCWKLEDDQEQTKLNMMKFYSRRRGMDFSVWTEKELRLN